MSLFLLILIILFQRINKLQSSSRSCLKRVLTRLHESSIHNAHDFASLCLSIFSPSFHLERKREKLVSDSEMDGGTKNPVLDLEALRVSISRTPSVLVILSTITAYIVKVFDKKPASFEV